MRDMTWFCDAYASWQKGGIENANGRLRRWLPRNLDIDQFFDHDIQEIVLTAYRVAPVGLDPLPWPLWDQGRRHHRAIVTELPHLPIQPVAGRPGLVADVQFLISPSQFGD